MKYGIFSDVHANIEALDAILETLNSHGVEKFVCLGDIVGYGPNPNEVVRKVAEVCDICVLGNHDNVALKREAHEHFNPHAQNVIDWTQNILEEDVKDYLSKRPYLEREDGIYFVHASPKSPADWFYVNSLDDSVEAFDFCPDRICFIGHTHCPSFVIKESDQSFKVLDDDAVVLQDDQRILINVGSVGQPRDRNPKTSACIYDSETQSFELLRIDYDFGTTQQKMKDLKFPAFLIHRLSSGQ